MAEAARVDEKLRGNYRKYAAANPLLKLDPEWLRRNDPMLALAAGDDPEFDYLGWYLGRQQDRAFPSPNPFFDWAIYDARSNYSNRGGRTPIEYDFLTTGLERNAAPNWLFRNEHFAGLRAGIGEKPMTNAQLNALRHNYGAFYLAFLFNIDRFERAGPLFSFRFYRARTGSAEADKRALLRHYLMDGHVQGLHGTPLFDEEWYRARYGEALAVGSEAHHRHRSALQHFLDIGVREGFSPIPDFDAEFYVEQHPEAADEIAMGWFASPVDHWLGNLASLNLAPNPYFDPRYYLEENPQVHAEMAALGLVNPLEHFLHAGYARGLRASQPLLEVATPEKYAKAGFEKRAALAAHQALLAPLRPNLAVSRPRVSLVIPVLDHFAFTAALLARLAAEYGEGSACPAEVIVVDNGSTDRTLELPELFPGIVYVRADEPLGYTLACNLGAERATAPVLVFMNNDIELGPGMLAQLAEALETDAAIGAAGPKIVLPDGRVQEAGGVLFANGGTAGFGRGDRPEQEPLNLPRDVDYVSGCALAVRREAWERVGPFDERFSPGYFEDTDLCLRLRQAGWRVRYLPQAWLTHYEYGTFSKGRPKEISYFRMYANKGKFMAKHRRELPEIGAPTEPFDLSGAAFRLGGKAGRLALMIEDLVPSRLYGSGFARSEDVVQEFLRRGWRLTILAGQPRPGDGRFLERYQGQVDIRYLPSTPLAKLLEELGPALDLVWVSRTHNIANLRSELLAWRRKGPGRRLVADTEALASLRNAFPGQGPSELQGDPRALEAVRGELDPAADFDEILCVNPQEAELASAALESQKVGVLGHRFELERRQSPPFESRHGFVFCGAIHESYAPNMDSLVWFCGEILPRIQARLPQAHLTFVGHVREGLTLPEEVTARALVLGQVAELAPVFDQHRVFVAPTRLAAGMPHKVQHAMTLDIPCVITRNLADQLAPSPELTPFLAAAVDPEDFAARCIELHGDAALWARVQRDARAEIEGSASPEAFSRAFDQVLEAALG
ncbi:MAG TPA: glycosyltransferase [Caulobacteraceae bacterium]|jgi:GT2 family glycosyltransferase